MNDQVMSLKDVIDRYGRLVWKCKGVSMRPMIRQETDYVTLVKPTSEPKAMDVAIYQRGDGAYVLHRIIGDEGKNYLILGDNCINVEHVPKSSVFGVLNTLTRNGQPVDLDGFKQKIYETLWIRPWRLRVFLLRVKNKCKRVLESR